MRLGLYDLAIACHRHHWVVTLLLQIWHCHHRYTQRRCTLSEILLVHLRFLLLKGHHLEIIEVVIFRFGIKVGLLLIAHALQSTDLCHI
jgi:hypothetical protein